MSILRKRLKPSAYIAQRILVGKPTIARIAARVIRGQLDMLCSSFLAWKVAIAKSAVAHVGKEDVFHDRFAGDLVDVGGSWESR